MPAKSLRQGSAETGEGGVPELCDRVERGRSWDKLSAIDRATNHWARRRDIAAVATVLCGPGLCGLIHRHRRMVRCHERIGLQRREHKPEAHKNAERGAQDRHESNEYAVPVNKSTKSKCSIIGLKRKPRPYVQYLVFFLVILDMSN